MNDQQTKKQSPEMARRGFLKTTLGTACALGFPTIIPATAIGKGGKVAPSERITMGIIGCGNRGRAAYSYQGMPEVEVVALADANAAQIKKFKSHGSLKGKALKETDDFRTMLADVDAVHIATGDHWHVPALLLAARAGKHAYVEKPLGISIEQCLACDEIVKEHPGLQVQYGTQNRSTAYVRPALELVLNGHIGEVKDVFVWCPDGKSGQKEQLKAAPEGFNLDMWLGPAPSVPYSDERCQPRGAKGGNNGIFHIYDYAIGYLAGWGAHPMDQLQWWLDEIGLTIPEQVKASGTVPTTGLFNTVTRWESQLQYSNGMNIHFADRHSIHKYLPKLEGFKPGGHGTLFVGSEGWVCCSRSSLQGSSRELLHKHRNPGQKRLIHSKGGHDRNFIEAILGQSKTVSNLSSAIRSDLTCHLVDQAIRNGGNVRWDDKKKTIVGNEGAIAGMRREMRKPWDVLNPKYTGSRS